MRLGNGHDRERELRKRGNSLADVPFSAGSAACPIAPRGTEHRRIRGVLIFGFCSLLHVVNSALAVNSSDGCLLAAAPSAAASRSDRADTAGIQAASLKVQQGLHVPALSGEAAAIMAR